MTLISDPLESTRGLIKPTLSGKDTKTGFSKRFYKPVSGFNMPCKHCQKRKSSNSTKNTWANPILNASSNSPALDL